MNIFVVDDEKNIRRSFEIILGPEEHSISPFGDAESCIAALKERQPDVIFLDVLLPGRSGLEVLSEVRRLAPGTDVVMISGHANLSMAMEAAHAGAYDFLEKPLQKEKILLVLRNIAERRSLSHQVSTLRAEADDKHRMIGESKPFRSVVAQIEKIAPTDSKVLIMGESGVGKELVAFAIHRNSPRAAKPFVKMNCAAIPEELTESELFGNEKGAFTGALEKRDGKFAQADGGTLFLDEIGDMSLKVQTKVLRVLQDGEFQRVGGKELLHADVRVVAATNQPLEQMVREGRFREDLFFRLNVLPVRVPPLRERQSDIPLLVEHFIQRYCQRNNRKVPRVAGEVDKILAAYHWPGNVRELQNLVERLVILSEDNVIGGSDLPASIMHPADGGHVPAGERTLSDVREAAERDYILRCLEAAGGNVSQAARMMGIERTNLHKKMKSLGLK